MNQEHNKILNFTQKKNFYASRKLGQNFLVNQNVRKKIVDSLVISKNDFVIEIGPGFGFLTKEILLKTKNLTVIELDKRLVEFLRSKFSNLIIINQDILKFDFEFINAKKYKIISNLPYSIASQVIFKLIKFANFDQAILMVQKEMAERITAKVGSKKYNHFTVLLKLTTKIEKLFDVSKNCFYPIPKVDSTVIRVIHNQSFTFNTFDKLVRFTKICFSQKRKTLFNNLKKIFSKEKIDYVFKKNEFDLMIRPEEISEDIFLKIFKDFYEIS